MNTLSDGRKIENALLLTSCFLIVIVIIAWAFASIPKAIESEHEKQLSRDVQSCTVNGTIQTRTPHCKRTAERVMEYMDKQEADFLTQIASVK